MKFASPYLHVELNQGVVQTSWFKELNKIVISCANVHDSQQERTLSSCPEFTKSQKYSVFQHYPVY